jgi:NADH-ubiquinone oxidoreductase chain 4
MLVLLVLVPISTAAIVGYTGETDFERLKKVALVGTLVEALISFFALLSFDLSAGGYQLQVGAENGLGYLSLGVDGLSLIFLVLTTFLTPVCLLASWENVVENKKAYFLTLMLIEALLVSVFLVQDLVLFYIFFEAVLVPLFLLVGVWGGSSTRARSALLLFLYTLTGSLFMLLAILEVRRQAGGTDYTLVRLAGLAPEAQTVLWLGFWLALWRALCF